MADLDRRRPPPALAPGWTRVILRGAERCAALSPRSSKFVLSGWHATGSFSDARWRGLRDPRRHAIPDEDSSRRTQPRGSAGHAQLGRRAASIVDRMALPTTRRIEWG